MIQIRTIDFWAEKYGSQMLVDLIAIENTPEFILDDAPHRLSYYDIMLITSGAGSLSLDFQALPVEPGNVVFTSPGQIRQWHSAESIQGVALFFTGEFVNTFFNDALFLQKLSYFHTSTSPHFMRLEADSFDSILAILKSAKDELASLQPDSEHMLRAILYLVLVRLNRLYGSEHEVANSPDSSALVHKFRQLLELHYREKHQVRDYAQMLGVSPDQLSSLTKRYSSAPAGILIRERLLIEAKRLLRYDDRTVEEVAFFLSFNDPSYFARFFRRETELSPGEFRLKSKEKYRTIRG